MKGKSLIDVLHDVQETNPENYIPENLAIKVSQTFKTTPAKVYGVLTFYTMFSSIPRGKHIIRVCRSLSCHLADGEKIIKKLKEELGIDFGETTEDKEFTLEESSCLGMCSVAPSMMIDDVPFGNLKEEDIPLILKKVREGAL
ncbi:NADH-quinone oxidoreductase subunit NuoE family protein [Caldisericum exile]|uniref:Formate dehydrogenase gamma subunit n=1 Tax=Caldisericum exile (strain DSM 21853 / NBRC 104410 / AZM16c01) TaxID=511051 RepID=A0A7U6JF24_CALEA|nr:NAD(P)H-dependent oxidoreductase subunit E [Caldisericum exile]BAL81321.1 putative formate dehydrogenase gamma subunit [Caldisericum exile AZM16c01]